MAALPLHATAVITIVTMESVNQSATTEDLVWHYTSLTTLNNILASGTLYATEVNFLNDIRETTAADELLEQCLEIMVERGAANSNGFIGNVRGLLRSHRDYFRHPLHAEEIATSRFVLCASGDSDSLYAWRTYGDKDSIGCAIGLDAEIPLWPSPNTPTAFSGPAGWRPVEYKAKHLLKYTLGRLESMRQRYNAQAQEESGPEPPFEVLDLLDDLRSVCKDPSFSQEREHRITFTGISASDVKMLPHPMGPRPHLPLGVGAEDSSGAATGEWGRLPIREIKLGPDAPDSAKASTIWMLESNGYSTTPSATGVQDDSGAWHEGEWDYSNMVRISQSELPYRRA